MSMTSPIKVYYVTQVILQMWPYDQSLVTPAFYERSYPSLIKKYENYNFT